MMTRPTLTMDEVCELYGIGRSAAYSAARRGEIPALRIGRRLVVPTEHVRRALGLELDAA